MSRTSLVHDIWDDTPDSMMCTNGASVGDPAAESCNIDDCTVGELTTRVGCILSYNGSTNDISINYILVLLNVLYCAVSIRMHGRLLSTTRTPQPSKSVYHALSMASLIFVVVFQIGLCLVVGCSGVSIIWCAVCGWILNQRRDYEKNCGSNNINRADNPSRNSINNIEEFGESLDLLRFKHIEIGVILMDVLTIVYYALTLPTITTVAHICAIILGIILSMISLTVFNRGLQYYDIIGNDDTMEVSPPAGANSSEIQ